MFSFQQHSPLIIAGPCSAETPDQILQVGKDLAASGKVHLFRAGVWKPRTRPGNFEGVGDVALPWLQAMKTQTGLPVTIEIANARQVEVALKNGIDVLWLGARTTANPFSVQEVADALKGVDVAVMIKNPTNADVDLWTGAVERIVQTGIQEIALVHRGFSQYGSTHYRNDPMWQLPLEMRRRFPDLAMICDPSHIAGKRDLLLNLAQKAADLGYHGLMIETHPQPEIAWSDAAQQVTPEQLQTLLNQIIWRQMHPDVLIHNQLEDMRKVIDHIDDDLLRLMSERMKVADKIGLYKREHNITILQQERWNDILTRALAKMNAMDLDEKFIKAYFDAVHLESIRHQTRVMNEPHQAKYS